MFQLQRLRVDDASVMFDQFSYSLVALNTCIYTKIIISRIKDTLYCQEYIIKKKRVSNFPIRSVECVRKVTHLER